MKNKILFVVCLLFGLMFLNAGLNKFFNYMPAPSEMPEPVMRFMTAFMQMGWLMPLVAVIEIVGGLLFMIPKTRALGAVVILPILVGILLTHFLVVKSDYAIPLVLLAIEIWVIIENWDKYLPMVNEGRRNSL
ncbi:MAG TPA: DoxX family protein [Bacteroidales bacterium]|nr:DoxX family protein [Bacteroidales bacterium]